jgi:hypothetical protein
MDVISTAGWMSGRVISPSTRYRTATTVSFSTPIRVADPHQFDVGLPSRHHFCPVKSNRIRQLAEIIFTHFSVARFGSALRVPNLDQGAK